MTRETKDQLADGLWDLMQVTGIYVSIWITIYYTYWGGWLGLAHCVAAALFGFLAVYWFGHMMPGVENYFKESPKQ